MNIEKIKESINLLLDIGATVCFDYKKSMEDWICEVKIYYFSDNYSTFIHNGPFHGDYKNREEAVNKFVECIFSENNIALLLKRIQVKYSVIDLEEFEEEELEKLVEEEKKLYLQED